MPKIHIEVDENGTIIGFASSPFSEDSFEVEIENENEILHGSHRPEIFEYKNGNIVKSTEKELKTAKRSKKKWLSNRCEREILGYFNVEIDGTVYQFSNDEKAQNNRNTDLMLMDRGVTTQTEWTAHYNGEDVRITLNQTQLLQVAAAANSHTKKIISRFRDELKPKVDAAETLEEINAIDW
ncbi:hypothetical protein [Sediminibacillus sp. JSM 1682029]|uniref:DUF4376 domain-containing protein n=1 Tax=Sediminibacillus sp. JSM 1682029 TaxID=3229857 RepID=UPI0035243DD5